MPFVRRGDRVAQHRAARSRRAARPRRPGRLLDADLHQLAAHAAVRPAWSRAYADDGLIVIGVHTPEFSFEHDIDLVRRAIDGPRRSTTRSPSTTTTRSGAPSTTTTGRRSTSSTAEGIIRDHHFGEGRYERSERMIQQLLGVDRDLVAGRGGRRGGGGRLAAPAHPRDLPRLRRAASASSPDGATSTSAAPTSCPDGSRSTTGHSPATWTIGPRTSCSTRPAAASPSGSTPATRTSCCRGRAAEPIPFRVPLDGEPPGRRTAWTSTRTGTACCATAACTSSSASTTTIRERTLEITFREAGAEAYAFTFG